MASDIDSDNPLAPVANIKGSIPAVAKGSTEKTKENDKESIESQK